MRVGTAVVLRSEIEPYLTTNGISWNDLSLHEPEFARLYGYTQNQWLAGEANPDSNGFRFVPWFVINSGKKIKILHAETGQVKSVVPEDLLVGTAQVFPEAKNISGWTPLRLYQSGTADAIPLPPLDSGRASVLLHQSRWIGLQYKDSDNLHIFVPRNRWDTVEVVDFVVGLPWIHAHRSRISHSKIGAGYLVKIPEGSARYYKSWKNAEASEITTHSELGDEYFYVPVNRMNWMFSFNRPAASRSWFSINWCFTGFKHLVAA